MFKMVQIGDEWFNENYIIEAKKLASYEIYKDGNTLIVPAIRVTTAAIVPGYSDGSDISVNHYFIGDEMKAVEAWLNHLSGGIDLMTMPYGNLRPADNSTFLPRK